MESIIGPISTLIGTLVSAFIPVEEYATKSICGQMITSIVSGMLNAMVGFFKKLSFKRTRDPELYIDTNSVLFPKFEDYVLEKFRNRFVSCDILLRKGAIDFGLRKQEDNIFSDFYKNHTVFVEIIASDHKNEKKKKSEDSGGRNTTEVNDESSLTRVTAFRITSKTAGLEGLKEYFSSICDMRVFTEGSIKVYQVSVTKENKKTDNPEKAEWEEYVNKTNKSTRNTIVSEHVEKNLFDDVDIFLNRRDWYNLKGCKKLCYYYF